MSTDNECDGPCCNYQTRRSLCPSDLTSEQAVQLDLFMDANPHHDITTFVLNGYEYQDADDSCILLENPACELERRHGAVDCGCVVWSLDKWVVVNK